MRAGRCWSRDRDGEQPVKGACGLDDLLARVPQVAQRWRAGDLDDVYYAAIYFLYGQIAAHGVRYASRRFRADARPDATECAMRLAEWRGNVLRAHLLHELERHHFRGVIPNVPAALAAWLRGEWPLQLCEHVPSARDVLRMQANGMRPVTLLADYPRLLQPVLAKPSAWAFMVHDLEHAYKFFHDPLLHAAQRRFFEGVARALAQGTFARPLGDAQFATKFDYLIGDMNAHPHHGLHYLRAILIEFYLREEGKPLHAALSSRDRAELNDVMAELAGEWSTEMKWMTERAL